LNFFVAEKNWAQGIDWYQRQFVTGTKIRGESSPAYANFPHYDGVPQRMHSIIPDAKLIYIVRDPIDRIISHYVMSLASGETSSNFSDLMIEFGDNRLVNLSRYFMQLERFMHYYPSSQVLILRHEQLLNERAGTLERVFRFLGVDPAFKSVRFTRKINKGKMYRRRLAAGGFLDRLPVKAWSNSLPSGIGYWLLLAYNYPFSTRIEPPEIDDELRQRLTEYFKDDVNSLNDLETLLQSQQ
jgi:hypothetical protein